MKEKLVKPIYKPNNVALDKVLEIAMAEDRTITVEHAIEISTNISNKKPKDSGILEENIEKNK